MTENFSHTIDPEYAQGNDILLLGIGNYLMGDEGVGVHFVNSLQTAETPAGVTVLDGGTGGFLLVPYLENHPIAILVDATRDGKPTGTVSLLRPKFSDDFPTALSGHNFGLKDMMDILSFLERMPDVYLFTVSIAEMKPMELSLSPQVQAAIPEVKEKVWKLIKELRKSKN
jgi:hydrogenase maturation protease